MTNESSMDDFEQIASDFILFLGAWYSFYK